MKDYYKILNVAPDSDAVVIQAAYKALMKKFHPDSSSEANATFKAAEINEAYENLSDPQRRLDYDKMYKERFGAAEQDQTRQKTFNHSSGYAGGMSSGNRRNDNRDSLNRQTPAIIPRKAIPWLLGGTLIMGFMAVILYSRQASYSAPLENVAAAGPVLTKAQNCLRADAADWHKNEITFDSVAGNVVYAFQVRTTQARGELELLDLESTNAPYRNLVGRISWSPTVRNRSQSTIRSISVRYMIFDASLNECRYLGEVLTLADNVNISTNQVKRVEFLSDPRYSPQSLPSTPEGYERIIFAILTDSFI